MSACLNLFSDIYELYASLLFKWDLVFFVTDLHVIGSEILCSYQITQIHVHRTATKNSFHYCFVYEMSENMENVQNLFSPKLKAKKK